jgi:chromosome segregation ATPase
MYSLVEELADIIEILSAIGSLGGLFSILSLAYWFGRKFAQIEERFKQIEERFKMIDERFKQIDRRFDQIDSRFKQADDKFEKVDSRFERLEASLKAYIDEKFDPLKRSVKSVNEFIVDFLSYEGVLKREAGELLKREISRVLSANPITDALTEEERKRLKELLEKDELTLEEADELYAIADKLVEKYGHKYTEVWKLLWYSRFWIGYNLRKQKEKKEARA